MRKKTKALSGASQDAYFRRVLKAHPGVSAEERDRIVRRLRQEVAQVRVRATARSDVDAMPPTEPVRSGAPATQTQDPPAAGPTFDPFTPNVVLTVRTSGRDQTLAVLAAIEGVDQLRLLAREQRLTIPADLASAGEIRAAIVTAAERRIANRLAAAS